MKKNNVSQGTLILRTAIGGYLLYLAFDLLKVLADKEGNQKILFICAIIVFGIVGAVLAVTSIKHLATPDDNGDNDQDDKNNEQ